MTRSAHWNRLYSDFARDESGATVIEYALIVSLIFLAIVAAVNNYAASTQDMYSTISSSLAG